MLFSAHFDTLHENVSLTYKHTTVLNTKWRLKNGHLKKMHPVVLPIP